MRNGDQSSPVLVHSFNPLFHLARVDKGRFIGIVNRVADPLSGSSQLDSVKQAQSQKDAAKAQQELVKEVEEEESDVLLAKDVMQDAMTDVLTRRGLLNTTTSGAHSAVAAWARRAGSAAGAGSLSSEGSEEEGKAEALGRRALGDEWYEDRLIRCSSCHCHIRASERAKRGVRCMGCLRWFHDRCAPSGTLPTSRAALEATPALSSYMHCAECQRVHSSLQTAAAERLAQAQALFAKQQQMQQAGQQQQEQGGTGGAAVQHSGGSSSSSSSSNTGWLGGLASWLPGGTAWASPAEQQYRQGALHVQLVDLHACRVEMDARQQQREGRIRAKRHALETSNTLTALPSVLGHTSPPGSQGSGTQGGPLPASSAEFQPLPRAQLNTLKKLGPTRVVEALEEAKASAAATTGVKSAGSGNVGPGAEVGSTSKASGPDGAQTGVPRPASSTGGSSIVLRRWKGDGGVRDLKALVAIFSVTRSLPPDEDEEDALWSVAGDSWGAVLRRTADGAALAGASVLVFGADHARLQGMATLPGVRRSGHATLLLRELCSMLGEAGVPRVVALTRAKNPLSRPPPKGDAEQQQQPEEENAHVFHDGPSGPGASLLKSKLSFQPLEDFSLLAHWRDQWMPYYSPHSLGRNVAYLVKELPANKVADGNGKAQ